MPVNSAELRVAHAELLLDRRQQRREPEVRQLQREHRDERHAERQQPARSAPRGSGGRRHASTRVSRNAATAARAAAGSHARGIDDVRLDRQHRNAGLLERALDEQPARRRRLHAARAQDQRPVDAMVARLLDDPLGRPRRVVQVFVEARRAAGQRRHRIVESVADVAVGAEGEIHRPDEHGAGATPRTPCRSRCRATGPRRPTSGAHVRPGRPRCPRRRAAAPRRGTRARARSPSRCRAPTASPSRW